MASLLPLIQDLLPMIMPTSVHVARAGELSSALSEGADATVRKDAIVDNTDKMCASVLVTKAGSTSTVRHHGEQDTIIYAASGEGILLTNPDVAESSINRHALSPGDFALIPPWTEHQILNESGEVPVVWILIRNGPRPVEVHLAHWGGPQTSA